MFALFCAFALVLFEEYLLRLSGISAGIRINRGKSEGKRTLYPLAAVPLYNSKVLSVKIVAFFYVVFTVSSL